MDELLQDELNQAQWHQQVDDCERHRRVMEAWARIKEDVMYNPWASNGTKTDIDTIECELKKL